MNVKDYEIPWTPPDLMPGISLLLASRKAKAENRRADENAKTQRMFADSQLRRSNAQEARDHAEEQRKAEEFARKKSMDTAAALEHAGELLTSSPGVAQGYAKQYGIDIQEKPPAPAANPLLAAVSQPQAPLEPDVPPIEDTTHAFTPGIHGAPDVAAASAGPLSLHQGEGIEGTTVPEDAGAGRPDIPAPAHLPPIPTNIVVDEPTTITADVPKQQAVNKLYQAIVGGQTYDLSAAPSSTGLGEKYDAIYNQAVSLPGGKKVAFAKAFNAYEQDQNRDASAQRTADLIASREGIARDLRPDVATQSEWLDRKLHQSDVNSRRAANSRVSAAGAGPVSAAVPELIRMTEEGAPASEIYARAAKEKVPQKQFQAPIQNVVKNAAAAERAGQKREALSATDDHGQQIMRDGVPQVWKDADAAHKGAKQIEAYHRVDERLNVLIKDIESHGDRVLTPDEIQKRLSYAKSVVAALRPFNELSNTSAGQQMEEDIVGAVGTPGHGWLMGANADIIKHLRDEARGQHEAQLGTKLRPGGGSQLAPALGGPRRGATSGTPGAAGTWVPIPARLANEPEARGHREMRIDASGNFLGEFR